jgi:hypothetical protein
MEVQLQTQHELAFITLKRTPTITAYPKAHALTFNVHTII